MAKAAPVKKDVQEITVVEFDEARVTYCIVGESPFICHAMSAKAKRELLGPSGRKSAAARASNLKHNPLEEYRDSAYKLRKDASQPTYIGHLGTAFKKAFSTAALDQVGAKKAQMGRLTYVPDEMIGIYGVPEMLMSVVRSSDMNHTPDIRTRAIIPHWACYLTVNYQRPIITETIVTKLLAQAGRSQGIGDWRVEKGSGSYGRFRLVDEHDPEFQAIIQTGGRQAQIEAMDTPAFYDDETEELYRWFTEEYLKDKAA